MSLITEGNARRDEWVVLFVDMQESTAIKYRLDETEVIKVISKLYRLINQVAEQNNLRKFTGDGAMIGYQIDPNSTERMKRVPLLALNVAVKIIQYCDRLNYRFEGPPIHIRVGIAAGRCRPFREGADDLIGKPVDLAKRLCDEARPDSILVDEVTLEMAGIDTSSGEAQLPVPGTTMKLCDRRLSLKGVPLHETPERFWDVTVDRFSNPSNADLFSNGLVALYLDRKQLQNDFSIGRLIEMARPGSRLLVAGRTLLGWTRFPAPQLLEQATKKDLKIWFMIVSEHALRYLDAAQQEAAKHDLGKVLPYFQELLRNDAEQKYAGTHFRVYRSDFLILDGITCAELSFKTDDSSEFFRDITLEDINATPYRADEIPAAARADTNSVEIRSRVIANAKPAILWACTCRDGDPANATKPCVAHGLRRRTEVLVEKAQLMSIQGFELDALLIRQGEGLGTRNNHPRSYLPRMSPYLRCIRERRFTEVPAPFCVQLQVSARCSTHCRMCDHWIDGEKRHPDELSLSRWRQIFADLVQFGVRSVIFSGGEPLARPDIAELLRSARRAGLRIGLLTNGTVERNEQDAQGVLEAIAASVDWVAISIDGTEEADDWIRRLHGKSNHSRKEMLRNFCAELLQRNSKLKLSATVTLQAHNIGMNLSDACNFIQHEIGIPQINFKFATGAATALATPANQDYRMQKGAITQFIGRLKSSQLLRMPGNNLAYLARMIDRGAFNVADIAEGAPAQSYYVASELRCFTPFLFSLIDYDGQVYPCCHLYRDNHVMDGKTKNYRAHHSMGSVRGKDVRFEGVWNGAKYASERESLVRIDPRQPHFEPCGECTRHCQHNSVLSSVEKMSDSSPDQVERELENLSLNDEPVWF